MSVFPHRPRHSQPVLLSVLVTMLVPMVGGAGEFKISRYIEPNQMSNLFTRHVRKGIIKRIRLTDAQLYQIRDTIDPHRETLLAQLTAFKDARIEVVYAVASEPFDPERVKKAHASAAAAELELTLTAGSILNELRPILTEDQMREVGEMMEEVRQASENRFADFSEKLVAGELLGLKAADPVPSLEEKP